jgi:uncharacterized protein with GYD domain
METSVILMNFTEQGIKNLKETPGRIEAARKRVEAAGGKMIGWYLTEGKYDAVAITQVPDAKTGMALLLATVGQGNIRTETLRAFTEAEFKEILAKVP